MSRLGRPELDTGGEVLRSRSFDDIYYSPEDGLAESAFVFVDGNDLHRRLAESRRGQPFVVGELGFGTGLNILALLAAHESADGGPLDIWTCEGFPLPRDAFGEQQRQIAARWPQVARYADRLAETYPEPVPGQARLDLGDGVSLTIAFGTVLGGLASAIFRADAWFLDGFAPSKNPDMWSPEVMAAVAGRSKDGATAATFSVASGVRAALQSAGFSWEKAPGFGRKRHMLRAHLESRPAIAASRPWFSDPSPSASGGVAIIGAGIAGASVAHALTEAERACTLFGTGSRGEAASANPAGLLMPRLDADDTPAARFYRDAFLYALRVYERTGKALNPCGGTMAMAPEKFGRHCEIGLWADGAFAFEAGRIRIDQAGVLDPLCAVEALSEGVPTVSRRATDIRHDGDGWRVVTDDGEGHGPFAAVVLATGAAQDLWHASPVRASLGQIDRFEGPQPQSVITDGSYVAPCRGSLIAGATYAAYVGGPVAASPQNTSANRAAAAALLGEEPGRHLEARAALRATTPDRHPVAGPLYDEDEARESYAGLAKGLRTDYPDAPYRRGLYALTGLGSRGLVTAPILGAHVAAQIVGGVSPLTRDVVEMVHPGRFLVRDLKRGKLSP